MWDGIHASAAALSIEQWSVLCIALGVTVLAAAYMVSPGLRAWRRCRRVRRAVARLGHEVIEGAVIPDGMGHALRVDYLVLCDNGISVVLCKQYPGVIFAAENMDMWVQRLPAGSFKFANPLAELRVAQAAVRALIPDVEVRGVLLFTDGSRFPKGKPESVTTLEELDGLQPLVERDVARELELHWERLRTQNNQLTVTGSCY